MWITWWFVTLKCCYWHLNVYGCSENYFNTWNYFTVSVSRVEMFQLRFDSKPFEVKVRDERAAATSSRWRSTGNFPLHFRSGDWHDYLSWSCFWKKLIKRFSNASRLWMLIEIWDQLETARDLWQEYRLSSSLVGIHCMLMTSRLTAISNKWFLHLSYFNWSPGISSANVPRRWVMVDDAALNIKQ